MNTKLKMIGRWAPSKKKAGIIGIKNDAVFRPDPGNVEVLCSEKANLFADGEDRLDVSVRNLLLLKTANTFYDDGAARFIVSAKHGRAVGADNIPFYYGTNIIAG